MSEPVDHGKVDRPFYTHAITGKCEVHGTTWKVCIHPAPDSKLEELLVGCIKCKFVETQEANK